jgi:hypothetical protein
VVVQDDYAGMHLDDALRKLLREFKLPGEAQQIDRIMEKFADTFCRHNAGMFRNAEDAYRLAFSTIMLNTDVHNPLADHMLSLTTFVEMNSDPDDQGVSVPVITVAELTGIFERISKNVRPCMLLRLQLHLHCAAAARNPYLWRNRRLVSAIRHAADNVQQRMSPDTWPVRVQEIEIVGKYASAADAERQQPRSLLNPGRLAAALGLAPILRSLNAASSHARGGPSGHSSVLATARRKIGHRWHTATSPQHVRTILHVSAVSISEVLKEGLRIGAEDEATYSSALSGLRHLVHMTSAAAMHAQCEDAVSMLCMATGVYSPALPGTFQEARQVQALQTLIDIALRPEGMHLGSAWWLLLRVLSILEGMVERARSLGASMRLSSSASSLNPTSPHTTVAPADDGLVVMTVEVGMRYAFAGLTAMLSQAAPSSTSSQNEARKTASAFFMSPKRGSLLSQPDSELVAAPGAALLKWTRINSDAVDAVYAHSTALDGEGIVLFMRSLCAVSTQELQPLAFGQPRVTALQRLAECLLLNMDRIRLIWSRVWAVAAPHFVAAACQEDVDVALVAVNALKQVVLRLLLQSELEQFNWQGAALKPFVDILRHVGEQSTRGMTMSCIQQVLQVCLSTLLFRPCVLINRYTCRLVTVWLLHGGAPR